MSRGYELANDNMGKVLGKMKRNFDKKAAERNSTPGDLVLLLHSVKRKYVTRQVHVNLLKEYVGDVEALGVTAAAAEETPMSDFTPKVDARLDNASQWECLEQELSHLEES
ncbi:hypothetical protein Pcinc_012440 [Petrolisthes cinctipes]|uniref:Uncharacterized protein n=1 Tax=Petrolisthes cinctipes TaxID=88211 RepID=A0AAE1KSK8_PETCI|nr:hypothetical protein Pcinc_012440 [Petrolisthes cinctipes]